MVMNEYLTHFIGNLNADYQDAIGNLIDEQLYFLPNDNCCHIAFHAWHFVRTEDNIINFVCQNRKPPVWIRQTLFEKWNLPKVAQGTGMARSEANALRLPSLSAFCSTPRRLDRVSEPYLANISEEELQITVLVKGQGEQTKLRQIMQTVITHGNRHLGQIMVLRSLQGLPGESM